MILFVHLYLNMNTIVKQEKNQIPMSKIQINGQDKMDTVRLTIKPSMVTIYHYPIYYFPPGFA